MINFIFNKEEKESVPDASDAHEQNYYWCSQKFWLGGTQKKKSCDVIWVPFFGDVNDNMTEMTS